MCVDCISLCLLCSGNAYIKFSFTPIWGMFTRCFSRARMLVPCTITRYQHGTDEHKSQLSGDELQWLQGMADTKKPAELLSPNMTAGRVLLLGGVVAGQSCSKGFSHCIEKVIHVHTIHEAAWKASCPLGKDCFAASPSNMWPAGRPRCLMNVVGRSCTKCAAW
jgi:hypothetical protein